MFGAIFFELQITRKHLKTRKLDLSVLEVKSNRKTGDRRLKIGTSTFDKSADF
jgi:hypothetical protein